MVWIDGRHHDEGVAASGLRTHLRDEDAVDCWDVYAAVSRDGGFRPIWADGRTGAYQLWTTRVRVR
ncbi:MAG: hypothetical protein ACODAE_01005 [Gemmatimonadota bacterium]